MNTTPKNPLLEMAVIEIFLTIISLFIAITAIIGGILMFTGLENTNLSLNLLQGTPFKDFFIPGILLLIIVGMSSSIASFMQIRNYNLKAEMSFVAGLLLTGWIIIEILLLNQPEPTFIEYLYLGLGLLMTGLSILLYTRK
jgi:hypothetical protein